MWNYLPEIKKVYKNIVKQTDELEQLTQRVNEMLCDELIKDCSIHKFHKETIGKYFVYEVHKDDFEHINKHLHLIQSIISPDMVVMTNTNTTYSYRVLFRKGQI